MNSLLLESPVVVSTIIYWLVVLVTVLVPFEETVRKRAKRATLAFIGLYFVDLICTLSAQMALAIFSSFGSPFIATAILQFYESEDWKQESKRKDFALQKSGQLVFKAIYTTDNPNDIPALVTGWAVELTKYDPEHADSYRDIITTFIG